MSTRPPSGAAKSPFRRPQVPRNLTEEQRSEERTSTWLELFFDLFFVVAVAALARGMHDDPTLGGALRFAGLFVPVWWSWMNFTWYATSFDNDDVPYRVTLLAAMLCMLGLAASVEGVGTEAGATTGFVLAYAVMRLLLVGLWVRARYHTPPALRGFASWYAVGNALGAVLWLASLALPAPAIYGAWAVALFVELLASILAARTLEDPRVSFHPRHIPERYGLFTIIVLGESGPRRRCGHRWHRLGARCGPDRRLRFRRRRVHLVALLRPRRIRGAGDWAAHRVLLGLRAPCSLRGDRRLRRRRPACHRGSGYRGAG